MVEKSLSDIDWGALGVKHFHPSPAAWEDQVLYFLMLDRFSDGREKLYIDNQGNRVTGGETVPFEAHDRGNAVGTPAERARWFEAGGRYVGGTLKGLTSKIGYLQRLGITAVWVSPIFKQVAFEQTYHGYGIQNFLDIDPHFGTRDDLRQLVRTAHDHGIYVILDIILNHTGDVFAYQADRYDCRQVDGELRCDPRWDGRSYEVSGFRDAAGQPAFAFEPAALETTATAWPDGAVWPVEFQQPGIFTCKGRIDNWDHEPEFLEGDFFSLKDVRLGDGPLNFFRPSQGLKFLGDVYKFWIAFADVDGFRVDTVKHMHAGATRYFTSVIHEFAQSIGKENFYLIGEITGGRRRAFTTLEETGLNAALGINDIPDRLEYLAKGYRDPAAYFDLFRNSLQVHKESHVWFRNKVVTTFDDHDQVRKGEHKARFCHGKVQGHDASEAVFNVLALLVTTLGIPCVYYGTEQCFDGHGPNDRYLRESMFGGEFGAFESRGRHFFNEDGRVYRQLAALLDVRRQHITLRRGRQYLRPISGDGIHFGLPRPIGGRLRSIVAWSRVFNGQEILVAINTDYTGTQTAWVTIDNGLHRAGETLHCIFSTDRQVMTCRLTIESKNGKSVLATLPAGAFVVYAH